MDKIKSLFLLKAICALFVVIIHFPLIGKTYIDPIIKMSVPIFYMITGYFLFKDINESLKIRLKKTIKKIFKLILASNCIYLIFNLLLRNSIDYVFLTWREVVKFIFFGDNISGHLYFLTSYFWGVVILSVLPLNILRKCLPWLSIFIVGNLLFGRYVFIIQDYLPYSISNNIPLGLKNNAIFLAIPCISMGYIVRKLHNKIPEKQLLLLFPIFLILIFLEFFCLRYYFKVYSLSAFLITTFPLCIITMLLFINIKKDNLLMKLGNRIGEKYSTDIYLWHPIIGSLITPILITYFSPIMALIIYLLCILFSYIILLIQNRKNASISR